MSFQRFEVMSYVFKKLTTREKEKFNWGKTKIGCVHGKGPPHFSSFHVSHPTVTISIVASYPFIPSTIQLLVQHIQGLSWIMLKYTDPLAKIKIVKAILSIQRRSFFYFVPEMFYFFKVLQVYYNP